MCVLVKQFCLFLFRFRNITTEYQFPKRTTFLLFWLNYISRMNGILLCSFRKHKRPQKNVNTIYSVIAPNERALKVLTCTCLSLLSVTITVERDAKRSKMDKSYLASAAASTFSFSGKQQCVYIRGDYFRVGYNS